MPSAQAQAPTPVGPTSMTIGQLTNILMACSGVQQAASSLTILTGLLGVVKDVNVTVPPGEIVVVAPVDSAFTSLLLKIGIAQADLATNMTLVASLLREHVAVAPSGASTTATTLTGNTLTFKTNGVAAPIDALVTAGKGSIVDSGSLTTPNVSVSIQCGASGPFVFGVDTVLVPKQFASLLATASIPAAAPTPAAAPSPAITPKSSAAAASLAAVAAMAAMALA